MTPDRDKGSEIKSDVRMLRRLFTLVPWRMRPQIIILVVVSALTSILDIIGVLAMLPLMQMLTASGELPEVVRRFVVPIAGTDDRPTLLLVIALAVAGAFVLKNAVTVVLRYWSLSITQSAAAAAQGVMLQKYTEASYLTHRRRSKATILQTVSSAVPSGFGVLLGYISILVDTLSIIALFLTILVLSPIASLTAVVVFGGSALLMSRVFKPWSLKFAIQSLDLNTRAWGFVNPAIEGFREARAFGRETLFTKSYKENRKGIAGLNAKAAVLAEAPKYLLEIVLIVGVMVVALILFATRDEATAFGLLAVFAAASIRIIPSFNRLVATLNGIRGARPSLALVNAQMEELADDRFREPEESSLQFPADAIVVRDVSFGYPDSEDLVLKEVTATIPWGSTVALVGSSGAGKTTFADILAGLIPPSSGSITVGGIDIVGHPRSWRSRVAMVSQRIYVWEATLRDLITFGVPPEEVDQERLSRVVIQSRLGSVVDQLPQGLDTLIGEGGARLSGGQIQRVGIARALYADPEVLILDEATSALDNETEHEITATIDALRGQLTVIVIAHRLSTVKNADEIFFFSKGRLQGRGTMTELASTDPEFARLVRLGSLDVDPR